jgi:hypothetical protein
MRRIVVIKQWFFCKPNETDLFGVNIRRLIQCLTGGSRCKWEYRTSDSEYFDHGVDNTKRYCQYCNRMQKLVYYPVGEIRTEWLDVEEF